MAALSLRSELWLGLLAAVNIAVAFATQIFVLAAVGPGASTDALIAASAVPLTLVTIVAVAIPAVVVPRLSGLAGSVQATAAWTLFCRLGLIGAAVSAALFLLAAPLTALLFRGFDAETAALSAQLLRVQSATVLFAALSSVSTSLLAAQSRFSGTELATAAGAVLTLCLVVWMVPTHGVVAAAWLQLLRSALLALCVFWLSGGVPADRSPSRALAGLRRDLKPLLAGNVYFKTEVLVDRHLLSQAAPGDLSLYGVGQQIHMAASGVLGKVWGSAAVTRLAELVRLGDRPSFVRLFQRNLLLLLSVSLCALAALAAIGIPLASLALEAGRISAADIEQLWWLMMLLGGVLVGGSLGALLAGAHYALGDTSTPTWMGVASYTCFVIIKFGAFSVWGVVGLCIATSSYYLTNAVLLALLLPRGLRRRFSPTVR